MLALVCAGVAILYGIISSRWILAQPAGSERMQAISAAVQEGAQAYLKRQYTTIGMVGVVLFAVIAIVPQPAYRHRLRHRRHSFRCGRLHRHERIGALERAHRASCI